MIKDRTQLIFKVSVFLIFIGRAWQHIFWDAPYRAFFWDESLLKPIVEGIFNTPWQEYATSERTDKLIQNSIKISGFVYLLAAISSLAIKKPTVKWFRIPIIIGGIGLVVLSLLMMKEKFYHAAQFFEHSIQFGLPFVLLYSYSRNLNPSRLIFMLKILIAFTFISHGLYAFGFYPVPGNFVDMVIQIFGFSETTSITLLYIAGILDFFIAALLFIPKVQMYALWYAFIWGLLTALARIVANFYIDFPLQSIHQNLHEVLYRLPHGLTPLLVIMLTKKYYGDK